MTGRLRACRLRSKKMNVPRTMVYRSLSIIISRLLLVCVFSIFGTSPFLVTRARAQSADWPMFAGNAAHTGVNDAETGPPPLELNWTRALSTGALNPVTVEGDRVFVTPLTYFGPVSPLWALSA